MTAVGLYTHAGAAAGTGVASQSAVLSRERLLGEQRGWSRRGEDGAAARVDGSAQVDRDGGAVSQRQGQAELGGRRGPARGWLRRTGGAIGPHPQEEGVAAVRRQVELVDDG